MRTLITGGVFTGQKVAGALLTRGTAECPRVLRLLQPAISYVT
jgi:hypothetical protein